MATNFSPCKGSYVLNQFPSNVMFGMNGFHVSASGAIQGHHGPLVLVAIMLSFANALNLYQSIFRKELKAAYFRVVKNSDCIGRNPSSSYSCFLSWQVSVKIRLHKMLTTVQRQCFPCLKDKVPCLKDEVHHVIDQHQNCCMQMLFNLGKSELLWYLGKEMTISFSVCIYKHKTFCIYCPFLCCFCFNSFPNKPLF